MKKLLKYSWVLIVPVMAVAAIVWKASAAESNTYFLPNPNDCASFFSVNNGVPILVYCPEGLHFNAMMDTCDWPQDAGCESIGLRWKVRHDRGTCVLGREIAESYDIGSGGNSTEEIEHSCCYAFKKDCADCKPEWFN